MRYIDIDELEFPPNWQSRANKALDKLRKEVKNAELTAQIAGEDVAVARKKAIADSLQKSSRQKIWKDLAPKLGKLSNFKCWYSESKNSGSDKDVDHFRPKGSVAEDPDHEGYWWLAFDWLNYRYSCTWCNQRRVDIENCTDGGKWDHFPLGTGSFRAKKEGDDHNDEDIELLDPIDPHDWKLLTFRSDGNPTPAKAKGTREHDRAKASIWFYHLDRYDFVKDRRDLARRVKRIIQYMETLRIQITHPKMKKLYKDQEKELLRLIDKKSEHSAAALAYARAEVYKIERGHQIKRDWLEEILHSNP